MTEQTPETSADLEALTALLERLVADRSLLVDVDPALRLRLLKAAGQMSHPDKHARKALAEARLKQKKLPAAEGDPPCPHRSHIPFAACAPKRAPSGGSHGSMRPASPPRPSTWCC